MGEPESVDNLYYCSIGKEEGRDPNILMQREYQGHSCIAVKFPPLYKRLKSYLSKSLNLHIVALKFFL